MNLLTALFQTKIHLSPAERALAAALEIMIIGSAITALSIGVAYIQHNGTSGIDFAALLNVMWISFTVAIIKGATALMPQVRTVVAQPVIDAISHLVTPDQTPAMPAPAPVVHVDATKLASEVVNQLPQSQIATLLPTLATLLKAELMKPVAPPPRPTREQYPPVQELPVRAMPPAPPVAMAQPQPYPSLVQDVATRVVPTVSSPPQGGSVTASPSQVWDQLGQLARPFGQVAQPAQPAPTPAQPNADWMTQGAPPPNRAG